jgi:hypothetical protein
MDLATSSFPDPVSPLISTGSSVGATLRIHSLIRAISGSTLTNSAWSPSPTSPAACTRNANFPIVKLAPA